eukprot:5312232-Pleurochrysis_carterae.AAC.1
MAGPPSRADSTTICATASLGLSAAAVTSGRAHDAGSTCSCARHAEVKRSRTKHARMQRLHSKVRGMESSKRNFSWSRQWLRAWIAGKGSSQRFRSPTLSRNVIESSKQTIGRGWGATAANVIPNLERGSYGAWY